MDSHEVYEVFEMYFGPPFPMSPIIVRILPSPIARSKNSAKLPTKNYVPIVVFQ